MDSISLKKYTPLVSLLLVCISLLFTTSAKALPTTVEYQSGVALSNDVVVDGFTYSNQISDSQLHGFQYFDPSLGTLLSVDISIHSEYAVDLEVMGQNTSINPFIDAFQASAQASATSSIAFFPGGFDAGFDTPVPTATTFATTCYGGVLNLGNTTCNSRYSDDVLFQQFPDLLTLAIDNSASPTDISAFLGTGMFDVLANLETSINLTSDYIENDTGFPVAEAWVNWSSLITVAYTYEPSSVPEPSPLILLCIGLAGLGIFRRKQVI